MFKKIASLSTLALVAIPLFVATDAVAGCRGCRRGRARRVVRNIQTKNAVRACRSGRCGKVVRNNKARRCNGGGCGF